MFYPKFTSPDKLVKVSNETYSRFLNSRNKHITASLALRLGKGQLKPPNSTSAPHPFCSSGSFGPVEYKLGMDQGALSEAQFKRVVMQEKEHEKLIEKKITYTTTALAS